jgi:hypothetical protein
MSAIGRQSPVRPECARACGASASYALVGSLGTPGGPGALTGAYLALTDGADDLSRERWAAEVLETGFFYAASRLRIIEGTPEPPDWLEVFETDQQDPLTAYARSLETLAGRHPATEIRQRNSGSFRLVSSHHGRARVRSSP